VDVGADVGGYDDDVRALLANPARRAGRDRPAADDEHAPAGKVEEQRVAHPCIVAGRCDAQMSCPTVRDTTPARSVVSPFDVSVTIR
jgi:hypothetical protein